MRKYKKDLTTLDYLLSKISSKIDTSHLDQQPTMDLTMAPRHCSPLEPPNLQVKAALMEAEVEAVTDGDGNRGGSGGGNSDSDSGGGRQQQGQATINHMQRRSAAVATAVGGGGGERADKYDDGGGNCSGDGGGGGSGNGGYGGDSSRGNGSGDRAAKQRGRDVGYYLWLMSYVEQYYLANSGDILASFLASACANKLFARQIWILAFAFFDSANTICQ
jgi:hypothetical protein